MKGIERKVGDAVIVDLQGKILFGSGDDEFREILNHAVDTCAGRLILNLGDVPYIDSAGISELVRAYARLNKVGGHLKLVNLSAKVRDLLTITKLLTVFEAFDSEEEALQSFS